MTTTAHTAQSLETLELGELRKIFTASTGLGCGVRKPATLIKAILDTQAKATSGADTHATDDQEPEPEVVDTDTLDIDGDSQKVEVVDDGSTAGDPDPEATDPEATATDLDTAVIAPEPIEATTVEPAVPVKVKVTGTGAHTGSTLLCDLLTSTGTFAVVQVLGKEVRFRVSTGEPVRMKKSWQTAGWVLDTDSLPEMTEPSVEELAEMPSRDLSNAQLRMVYTHVSGRTTSSTSRTYLLARVKAAKAGSLPQGTRRAKSGEPVKVIPVGMPVPTVEALDGAWRRAGFKNRISFIRQALSKLLVELGEDEVAKLVV
jgi:hypothetical protein